VIDIKKYKTLLEKSANDEPHHASPYQDFEQNILKKVSGICLEVGCGDGFWTNRLRNSSKKLYSIDLSKSRIINAKKRTKNKVNILIADARRIPFKDNFFDTVCAFEIIEHLPNYSDHYTFLKEVKRILKPGGKLLITTPNKIIFKIYCLLSKEKHSTHFSELTYFQFRNLLKKYFFVEIYGKFGWMSPLLSIKTINNIHNQLSKIPLLCKTILAIGKK
jgi:ubiquinone/menaquinone biosynthesis C-methylase UbiE